MSKFTDTYINTLQRANLSHQKKNRKLRKALRRISTIIFHIDSDDAVGRSLVGVQNEIDEALKG